MVTQRSRPLAAEDSHDDPGACICLRCGFREAYRAGVACRTERCPECGATTVREGSPHYAAFVRERLHRGPKR